MQAVCSIAVKSMVMLGPPNQGAAIARRLAPSGVFGIITGKGGMELGPQWDDFVQHFATPPFPSPSLPATFGKPNPESAGSAVQATYIVSVEEARLDGSESVRDRAGDPQPLDERRDGNQDDDRFPPVPPLAGLHHAPENDTLVHREMVGNAKRRRQSTPAFAIE